MNKQLLEKYDRLKTYLASLSTAAVAFSGGVDSTFLLFAAREALGDHMIAVTSCSASFPKREQKEAIDFCHSLGIKHVLCQTDELQSEGFMKNPPDRCYICKKGLFTAFLHTAAAEGMSCVIEGSNLDDEGDYRPGLKAIAELGILSPLRTLRFTKEEIRILSRHFDLPTWSKPSYACLASRFPYGEPITAEKLHMVEQGEALLMDMGFQQMRVRIHGKIARIEVLPAEFPLLLKEENRLRIVNSFKAYGFSYVSMDLAGYRTGSMNETLSAQEKKPSPAV